MHDTIEIQLSNYSHFIHILHPHIHIISCTHTFISCGQRNRPQVAPLVLLSSHAVHARSPDLLLLLHHQMRHYVPKPTFTFCHTLLTSRLVPLRPPSPSHLPLLFSSVHALLTTSGLLPAHPDLALLSLNPLLRALSRGSSRPHPLLALRLLLLMLSPSSPLPAPDHLSFPFALSAASLLPSPAAGAQLHALLLKNSLFPSDHYVTTALLHFYSARPEDARRLFDGLPRRDAVHYDLLVGAYLRAGLASEGVGIVRRMFLEGVEPDVVVLTTALTACAHAGALDYGVWVHRYIERSAPEALGEAFVGSALVSMYGKCGCVDAAVRVFEGMPERNAHVWGTMVGAFAVHGMAAEAVASLERMVREDGVRPDGVAVLGVLAACAHAGLVEEGLRLLGDMERQFGVAPGHDHYSCVVDMLCRVGRLEDAVGLIKTMPMRPLAPVWGAVLSACRVYGNVELAEVAAAELQGAGDDDGVYVQLSNIYLNANRKDDARRVRRLIGSRGIKKAPAVSAIEVDGEVSSFLAGDQAHPRRLEIREVLELLADQMGRSRKAEEEDEQTSIAFS